MGVACHGGRNAGSTYDIPFGIRSLVSYRYFTYGLIYSILFCYILSYSYCLQIQ